MFSGPWIISISSLRMVHDATTIFHGSHLCLPCAGEMLACLVVPFFWNDVQPQLGMMIPNASDIHLPVNEKKHFSARINPLLIGGLEHGWIMTFPQYMGMSYSQLTFLFVRGVGIPPTRHFLFWIFNVRFPWFLICVLQWISQEYPKNGYIACRSLLLWVA